MGLYELRDASGYELRDDHIEGGTMAAGGNSKMTTIK